MNKKICNLIKFFVFSALLTAFSPGYGQGTEEQYRQAIESGDKYFGAEDYLNAKASYQIASQLKPGEEYPKNRLQESIRLLRIQMEHIGVYNEKLSFADALFNEGAYEKAILAYQEALKIMPAQEYPREQIELIKERKAEQAQKLAEYQNRITSGDKLFAAEDYTEAIKKYEDALALFPGRQEAKDKISLANEKLTEIAARQSGYQKALSEAKMFHARKDYEKELEAYQTAAELKPDEALPQIKISELNEFLKKYEAYTSFVSEADELYIQQKFVEAKTKYEQALTVLPDESYPKEIISKINVALSEKTEMNKAAYEEAIAKADELYNQENYDAAMLAYSDALRYWPGGEHANARIGRITEIMALKKAQEEAYTNTISLADKLFAAKEYEQARAEYLRATQIKSFEQYPKVRIEEIDMILAELKNMLEQYEQIIQGADKLFNVGDYKEARIQYLKAQEILSDRSYPVDQVRMIDEILGLEKNTRDLYLAAIERADEHFAKREWEDAKLDYVEANDLIPEEEYPDEKINEINEILARLKAEQETYTLALKNADQLFSEKDYPAALAEYRKAADIFTDEEYPRQKIEEINNILAALEQERILNENYTNAIAEADKLLADEKYTEAKAGYQKAAGLKPGEQYPQEQIRAIDSRLAEIARLEGIEESYTEAIGRGDAYFENQQYEQARAAYNEALAIKAEETYPAGKITEIDGILAETALRQATEAAYAAAIASADRLFAAANYKEAIASYSEAESIKPDETYPAEKIEEIGNIVAAEAAEAERLARLNADYAQAISEGDALLGQENFKAAREKFARALELKPQESYPREKINEIDNTVDAIEQQRILDENYAKAIAEADELLADEKYTEAKAGYQKAAGLKPGEQYPQEQIRAIDSRLAEIARLEGIEESYTEAIGRGDAYFENQQYEQARAAYNEALAIKAEETYPAGKITEIDGILAEIAQRQATEAAYAATIARADSLFASEKYEEASASYSKAADIKPDETYPADRIAAIELIFDEQARIAKQNEQYSIAISTADNFLGNQQYEEAREAYVRAQKIKADEAYPSTKIAEIDALLLAMEEQRQKEENFANSIARGESFLINKEYEQARTEFVKALEIKATEQYPADKIVEIDSILAEQAREQEIETAYAAAIARADKLLIDKEYTGAREAFTEALELKPADEYAGIKLEEVNGIIEEMNRLKEIEERYSNAIAAGDKAMANENYVSARKSYTEALKLKSDAPYPGIKIAEIDSIMQEQARQEAIQRAYNKAIDESYARAISNADQKYETKNFLEALQFYEEAVNLKPGESYPGSKIAEINAMLEELQEERDKAYAAAIAQADSYYDMGNYRSAKSSYQTAVNIKSEEQYARDRLDEVTRLYASQLEALRVDYQKYIADADNYFKEKIYDGAIESYRLAGALLPDEEYPGRMISRITKIINDNAITDVNKLAQVIPNNTDRRFDFEELPVNVRKQNYILIKARNLSDQDYKMLVNFGRNGSKTGGVVLQVPAGEGVKDYIIRIGALYRWFSEDNNWLSIYPEGGDIEVSLIRISKSD
ncbi:MAG: hypothetical protein RQ761_03905 [Bacteroidales bacterium]|nr:hypothetical protein [Bacteroidales bacterium]